MSGSTSAPEASATRIVKAQAAAQMGTPVAFNYEDLRRACDEHLAGVQQQSRQLIQESTAEADRIRREAEEAGRRDGFQQGLKRAEAQVDDRVARLVAERVAEHLETLLPAVRQIGEQLQVERDRCIARWEGDAIQLAVAIAEKLLRRTIEVDPTAADRLISEALQMATGAPQLTLHLSPIDYERLGGSVATVAKSFGKFGDAEVIADEAITPGGCLIETRFGRIDSRIETLLTRIGDELGGTPRVPAGDSTAREQPR